MKRKKQSGIALMMVTIVIALLGIMLTNMVEISSTSYAAAAAERDSLQAEFMAKSALNLTRLFIAQEPQIRAFINPMYQAALGSPAPQLPVWRFANVMLAPVCNRDSTAGDSLGVDFSNAEGFENLTGSCSITAFSEDGKLNVNDPRLADITMSRNAVAAQLFSLLGGYQSPSPLDALFSQPLADGSLVTRLDVIGSIIDWWDPDQQGTSYDPGSAAALTRGTEHDDYYRRSDPPYTQKNAAFDSIQELRLVRGMTDDLWSGVIEPDPTNPESRTVTIYSSGQLNVNEAEPATMLAQLCSIAPAITLCTDSIEQNKLTQLIQTVRALFPVPLFPKPDSFADFVEGKGGATDLYPMLLSYLGEGNALLFKPVSLEADARKRLLASIGTAAQTLSVIARAQVGHTSVRLDTVISFNPRWVPPPPNAGVASSLGVLQYYRVN